MYACVFTVSVRCWRRRRKASGATGGVARGPSVHSRRTLSAFSSAGDGERGDRLGLLGHGGAAQEEGRAVGSLLAPPGEDAPAGAVDWTRAGRGARAFDVVLANPPFRARHKIPSVMGDEVTERLAELYLATHGGHADYSHLFVDLAFRLLTPDGVVGFVLPAGVEGNSSAAPVRRLLAERGLRSVVDFRGGQLRCEHLRLHDLDWPVTRHRAVALRPRTAMAGALLEDASHSRSEPMRRQRVSRQGLRARLSEGGIRFASNGSWISALRSRPSSRRWPQRGTLGGLSATGRNRESSERSCNRLARDPHDVPAAAGKGGQLSPFHVVDSGAVSLSPSTPTARCQTPPSPPEVRSWLPIPGGRSVRAISVWSDTTPT